MAGVCLTKPIIDYEIENRNDPEGSFSLLGRPTDLETT